MLMMVDAYEPLGFTTLSVGQYLHVPHLGVLSTVNEKAAKPMSSSTMPGLPEHA